VAQPSINFNPSRKYSPWRVYFRGKSYWFSSQVEAERKRRLLLSERRRLVHRLTDLEVEEFLYCRKLMKGIPLHEAVDYFRRE
jgi:hypothetical protein